MLRQQIIIMERGDNMKRNPLNKRLKRDLLKNKGRYAAIAIMIIATIVLLSGMLAETDAVTSALYNFRENNYVEDGQFQSMREIDEDSVKNVQDIGINIYKNYYYNFKNIKDSSNDELEDTTIRIYKERKSDNNINVESLFEGREPKENDEIAIDRLFLQSNNLKLGDTLKIDSKEYKIVGTTAFPDYTCLFEKNTNLLMDTYHFGVAIVSDECFNSFDKSQVIYNYSYRFKDRDLDKKQKIDLNNDVKEKLVENKVMLTGFLSQENNQCITFVDDDLGSDVPMIKNFSLIIIGIMAFVFAIVILSTIDEEAKIIGTLLSLGYKKWEIIFHYLKMPFYISLFGAVVGNILGYTVMPKIFGKLYYENYSLPPSEGIKINMEALILSTVVPILIMVLVNMIMLRYKMSITPLKFLRKDLKRHNKKGGMKLPNIKFFNRFRIRVILQNKANYLMLLIGILLGNVILLFGICITPTINKYIDDIRDTAISNYQYILKAPIDINDDDAEKYILQSMEAKNIVSDKDMDVSLYGIQKDSKYLKDLDLNTADKGIYVSDGLLKKMKKKIGDNILLTDKNTAKEYELKIEGSIDYDSGLAAFMNNKSLNALLHNDADYYNGYLSNEELNIDEENILTKITVNDLTNIGTQMLSSFSGIASIMLIAAVLIFVALMYILTKIVIDKNATNISYMKVFGYNSKEINKLYLRATTIVIVAAILISLPLAYYILVYLFESSMAKVSGYIEAYVSIYEYLIMFASGIVCYLVVNFFHIRRVNKITMTDALKDRE